MSAPAPTSAPCLRLRLRLPQLEGRLTKAADAYSFGVLCWEMYQGRAASHGSSGKPLHFVLKQQLESGLPPLPETAPASFRALVQSCMVRDPALRPQFPGIMQDLLLSLEAVAGGMGGRGDGSSGSGGSGGSRRSGGSSRGSKGGEVRSGKK